ncbi:MAG: hypothetical protein VX663_08905 [Pseudomonadota bacterium]|nr:hypothetical protein [Pseudomonadota bacterium]
MPRRTAGVMQALATLGLVAALIESWVELPVGGVLFAAATALGLAVAVYGWLTRGVDTAPWTGNTGAGWWTSVLIVTVVAAAARWWTLTDRPVWDDEMWTLRIVYGGSLLDVLRICIEDYWPPLHYLVQNIACRIGDTGVLTLRLPSMIAGAATVPLLIWLGRTVGLRRGGALFAGLLLAVSVPHVLRSQESRVYALQIALIVWSYAALWRSLPRERVSGSYIVATTLVMYAHQLSFLVLLAQWTFLVLAKWWLRVPISVGAQFRSQIAVGALTAPLFVAFVVFRLSRQEVQVPLHWASGEHDLSLWLLIDMIQTLAVRSWTGIALLLALSLVAAVRCLAARPASGPGDVFTAQPGPDGRALLLMLVCWLAVPICATFLISWLTPLKVFGVQRYHLFLIPALALLLALGFDQFRSRGVRTVLLGTVAIVGIHDLHSYYTRFERAPYDQAAEYVRERRVDGEMIYVGNGYRAFSYYYKGQYPRIGSPAWRDFVAQFDGLENLWTDHPDKYGSSYPAEKMPAFIEFLFGGSSSGSYAQDIEQYRGQGKLALRGAYWLVLGPGQVRRLRDDLERLGTPCHTTDEQTFGPLRVVRCEQAGLDGRSPAVSIH